MAIKWIWESMNQWTPHAKEEYMKRLIRHTKYILYHGMTRKEKKTTYGTSKRYSAKRNR